MSRPLFYEQVLRSYYKVHNPKLIDQVESILNKWRGHENDLLRKISSKYGEHPLDAWAARSSPHRSPPRVPFEKEERRRVESMTTKATKRSPRKITRHVEKKGQTRNRLGKLVLVLDLDETLVHSTDISGIYSPDVHSEEQLSDQLPESFVIGVNDDILHVRKRPGVDLFLRRAAEMFDVRLYTAGEEDYAKAVVNKLDPNGRIFTALYFRTACIQNDTSGEYTKDLSTLPGVDLRRCVLVDNNPGTVDSCRRSRAFRDVRISTTEIACFVHTASFFLQPNNGILIESFFVSPTDNELGTLFDVLCHMNRNCEDVREFLAPLRS